MDNKRKDVFQTVGEYKGYNKMLVEKIKEAGKDRDYSEQRFQSRVYRHYHVAYCMLRGTPYEKIEAKIREDNEPDWAIINRLIDNNKDLRHVSRERQETVDSAS